MSSHPDESRIETVDLLVLGGDVVTMDPDRTVIRGGAVAVHEGRITWMGTTAEAQRRFGAARRIEAAGRIVLPGLVDTHFHTGQQLLRGKITELAHQRQLKLPIWRNYLIPFESVLTDEDMYLSAQIAYANLLRVGTTCFTDAGGPHPDEMARAAMDLGIRGLVAQSTMDVGDGLPASMKFSTAEAIERNVSLIRPGVCPQSSGGSAPGCRCASSSCAAASCGKRSGTCPTSRDRACTSISRRGPTRWSMRPSTGEHVPAEYLEELGFLGPRVHAAHSILLSANEIDLYAERHVSAAHCPLGNFIIGPPKVPEMRRRAIRVGLGTDGASTGSLDLFEAMRVSFVALQSNYGTPWHDRSALSLEDLLEMATLGGAQALGMGDHIGSLEVGKQADLVIANPGDWDLQPVYDPMFTASRGLTGRDVETVIVDGKVVVEGGVVSSVDEAELRARLAERWPVIMSRFESITN